jgi:hypothetical protein
MVSIIKIAACDRLFEEIKLIIRPKGEKVKEREK